MTVRDVAEMERQRGTMCITPSYSKRQMCLDLYVMRLSVLHQHLEKSTAKERQAAEGKGVFAERPGFVHFVRTGFKAAYNKFGDTRLALCSEPECMRCLLVERQTLGARICK